MPNPALLTMAVIDRATYYISNAGMVTPHPPPKWYNVSKPPIVRFYDDHDGAHNDDDDDDDDDRV